MTDTLKTKEQNIAERIYRMEQHSHSVAIDTYMMLANIDNPSDKDRKSISDFLMQAKIAQESLRSGRDSIAGEETKVKQALGDLPVEERDLVMQHLAALNTGQASTQLDS